MPTDAQRAANNARVKKWKRANPEKVRASQRAYRQAEPEKARALSRRWYAKNPEKAKATMARTRAKRREQTSAYNKAYALAHKEALKLRHKDPEYLEKQAKRMAERRAADPEYMLEINRRHYAAHPERSANRAHSRRARIYGVDATLTHEQWLLIQELQDHRCAYCGKRCKGKLTQDHITPFAKGGAHTLHNVIGACQSCNSKKHAGPPPIPVQPLLL